MSRESLPSIWQAQSGRTVRTISQRASAMIPGASLIQIVWGVAVLAVSYLMPSTPTKTVQNTI